MTTVMLRDIRPMPMPASSGSFFLKIAEPEIMLSMCSTAVFTEQNGVVTFPFRKRWISSMRRVRNKKSNSGNFFYDLVDKQAAFFVIKIY